MEFKDYYQILGVEKNASADEIKKAYRKLARKYHPDVSKETDAAQRMAEINEANTVLSDAEKRKAYDQLGAQAYAQGMGAGGHYQPPPAGLKKLVPKWRSVSVMVMAPASTGMTAISR